MLIFRFHTRENVRTPRASRAGREAGAGARLPAARTGTLRAPLLALAFVLLAPFALAAQSDLAVIVTDIEGTVEFQLPGEADWQPLEVNDVVPLEARISTGFGAEAELAVGENAVVRALSLTRMSIADLVEEEGVERSTVDVEVGRINGEVQRTEDAPTEFELRSPVATASVRGTAFGFDGERVWVSDGQVAIANRFGREVTVSGGEESSTDGASRPDSPRQQRSQGARVSPYTERGGGEGTAPRSSDQVIRTGKDATVVIEFGF